MKGILPDDDYSKEAKEIYAAIKEHAALFETEKILSAKNIAALEEVIKGKRATPKKMKLEAVKPEPVAKKSCFAGTSLMSAPFASAPSSSSASLL